MARWTIILGLDVLDDGVCNPLHLLHGDLVLSLAPLFTFHSLSRYQGIFISLFILEMSEPDFHFTFHLLNFQYPLSQGTGPG